VVSKAGLTVVENFNRGVYKELCNLSGLFQIAVETYIISIHFQMSFSKRQVDFVYDCLADMSANFPNHPIYDLTIASEIEHFLWLKR